MMSLRETRTIAVALAIVREATISPAPSAQCLALQLALRVLLPYLDHRDLSSFWSSAGKEPGHNRTFRLRKQAEMFEVRMKWVLIRS